MLGVFSLKVLTDNNLFLFAVQPGFSDPTHAIVKTWVMMIGEFEYMSIFHEDQGAHESKVYYESSSFALFVIFMVLMAIIIMNLLVRNISLSSQTLLSPTFIRANMCYIERESFDALYINNSNHSH